MQLSLPARRAYLGAAIVSLCFAAVLSVNYRDGGQWTSSNQSHEIYVQLTDLKLTHFSHRGSLHVDRIELRSEDGGRNSFYVHNPTDPRYPLWAAARASVNSVWPKPASEVRVVQRVLSFTDRFSVRFASARDEVMSLAAKRCSEHLFRSVTAVSDARIGETAGTVGELEIIVRNANFVKYPHLGMREDYELTVSKSVITLVAQENWGVVRGLETLAQLIFVTRDQPNKFFIHENRITDRPAYEHRGLMIDTARHFIQKSTLLENLEALSINKMNVFHWHIVDDQSFPFLSAKFPELALKSAYPGSSYFYTVGDIEEIVEFARLRGIRVIPEFDSPDHTHSWGHGLPQIMSWCQQNGLAYMGPLNPISEETFQFLEEFFKEVSRLFPDSHLHLGMDEVSTDCWRLNSSFGNFMRQKGIKDYDQLIAHYSNRLSKIVSKLPGPKRVIVWEDILSKDSREFPLQLPPDTIVQVWLPQGGPKVEEWSKKYKIIRSDDWYLDSQAYGADWVKRYQKDLGSAIGGEACMWTEYQSDQTVTPHTWPSVSAVAERLWSGSRSTDVIQAAPRIEEQNCRMQARGIRVGVAGGPGMCQSPVSRFQPPWHHVEEMESTAGRLVNVRSAADPSLLLKLLCALLVLYIAYRSQARRIVSQLLSRSCRSSTLSLAAPRPGTLIGLFLAGYALFWLAIVSSS